jgi:hypothetical protein
MFSLFGTNQPTVLAANPAAGTHEEFAYDTGGQSVRETVDLVDLLADSLKQSGHKIERSKSWIEHKESGFFLLPQIVGVQANDDGSFLSSSTIQVNHQSIVPNGVFEYQYATGQNINEAFSAGFTQWEQADFIPLLDSLRPEPACSSFIRSALARRAIFGPATRILLGPQEPDATVGSDDESHVFCDCCLFTKSMDSFKEIFESDKYCCLRLYAARDEQGSPMADCRLNGEDYPPGAEALIAYIGTWPGTGYEARKQYVILHNIDSAAAEKAAEKH